MNRASNCWLTQGKQDSSLPSLKGNAHHQCSEQGGPTDLVSIALLMPCPPSADGSFPPGCRCWGQSSQWRATLLLAYRPHPQDICSADVILQGFSYLCSATSWKATARSGSGLRSFLAWGCCFLFHPLSAFKSSAFWFKDLVLVKVHLQDLDAVLGLRCKDWNSFYTNRLYRGHEALSKLVCYYSMLMYFRFIQQDLFFDSCF